MRPRQLTFFKTEAFKNLNRRAHGGEIRIGKRKLARPYDPKRPVHIVLRSSRAKGEWSFLRARNEKQVKHLIYREAARSGVRVYQYANSGNHLHLLLKAKSRHGLARFLRVIGGLIARAITGAKKGRAIPKIDLNLGKKKGHSNLRTKTTSITESEIEPAPSASRAFWDALAFSRIVEWGREFVSVRNYLTTNELEGMGWWDFGRARTNRAAYGGFK